MYILDCYKGEHPHRKIKMSSKIKSYLENHRDLIREGGGTSMAFMMLL
jgi:hypothetical protein